MNTAVFVPFAASLLVAALSRLAGPRLWPRAAAWATTAAAAALAATAVGALAVLASPVVAQVPVVATLGRWRPVAIATRTPVPDWLSIVAVVTLLVVACRLLLEVRAVVSDARGIAAAQRSLASTRQGELVVTADEVPRAYAVPGVVHTGAIVVSSGMLALLDDEERAAVLAHERSHLKHRHELFEVIVRVAAALNPLLLGLRHDVRFAVERWADEDAAAATDRPVAASALARSALATLGQRTDRAPQPVLALHADRVVARVAALLNPPPERVRSAWLIVAAAAVAAVALGWAMHETERFYEAARLWPHH
jgi:beta-lactamase regulating signal transducer with metallopeptidase domain